MFSAGVTYSRFSRALLLLLPSLWLICEWSGLGGKPKKETATKRWTRCVRHCICEATLIRVSRYPSALEVPKDIRPRFWFDSSKWTYHSSINTPARSWINHGAPFFAWKVHLLHRGKLILIAIRPRIPAASSTNCFIRLRQCFCRPFDGWKSGPIAWPYGPDHHWSCKTRPGIASWRIGSIGVAHVLWATCPFQIIFSIVAAITVNVIHLPGCITGWRSQKGMSNQSVYLENTATNINLTVATCPASPVRDSAETVSAPPQWTHLPVARRSSFQTFRW